MALVLKAIDADPFRSRDRSLVIRHWEEADLPAVAALWDEQDHALDLRQARSPALWDYWLRHDFWVGAGRWHVVTEGGRIVGCFALPAHEQRYIVYYLAALERDVILEIYRFAASTALENGQPQVLLRLPADGPAHAVALSVGGRSERNYGWQMKVYDRAGLLRALAPVSRLFLAWTDGRLASVAEEPSDGASVPRARLPVEAFTQLVLGYRSVSDLLRDSQNVQASRAVAVCLRSSSRRSRRGWSCRCGSSVGRRTSAAVGGEKVDDIDPNLAGAYLWSIPIDGRFYPHYVGEANSLRNRIADHRAELTGGSCWLYDPDGLRKGSLTAGLDRHGRLESPLVLDNGCTAYQVVELREQAAQILAASGEHLNVGLNSAPIQEDPDVIAIGD